MPRPMGTVVNVLGLQRSGTTMLALMLGAGTNAIACGEIGGWFRIAQHREGENPPDTFLPLRNVPADEFHERALDYFDVDFIIDSTKSLEWALDVNKWSKQSRFNVFNILIWKSPIQYTYSQWKRGLNDSLTYRYYKYPFYHRRLINSGAEFVTVKYDELVRRPSSKLRTLCRHIGINYFEGKEEFWNYDFDIAGSSPGVQKQAERGSSHLTLETHPPEFERVAKSVRNTVRRRRAVRRVLSKLEEREVSNVHIPSAQSTHQYTPSVRAQIEHQLSKTLKDTALRARWNLIQPRFGEQIEKVKKAWAYIMNKNIYTKSSVSFDPESENH